MIAHTIVRCHAAAGDGKVWGSEAECKDFLLAFAPVEEETDDWQTDEQMKAVLLRYAEVHNAQLKARGG